MYMDPFTQWTRLTDAYQEQLRRAEAGHGDAKAALKSLCAELRALTAQHPELRHSQAAAIDPRLAGGCRKVDT